MPLKEFLFFAAFLAAWIVLNRWVLPWFGISTCMSGACAVDARRTAVERPNDAARSDCPCCQCGTVLDETEAVATPQGHEEAQMKGDGT